MPGTRTPPPFDSLAESYDEVFTNSAIGQAQRAAVWRVLDHCFRPGERILELNCGTGVDAMHLGERGVEVLACDIAPKMIQVACRRLRTAKLLAPVRFRVLATEDIGLLEEEGLFDGVFSNFAGLNCVENLPAVARELAHRVKPGGRALLCMAGHLVAWEVAWYLAHGNARKAFRRFQRHGVDARLSGGETVRVQYYTADAMFRIFAPEFRRLRYWGIGLAVPPSYLENWVRRHPQVFSCLVAIDRSLGRVPLLRDAADHSLLEFERL